MTLVVVESPYQAWREDLSPSNYQEAVNTNLSYLRAALKDCFQRGEAPFASHGLYTQPGVLDDTVRVERQLGIEAGLRWGKLADKSVVYVDRGISVGMRAGIERAIEEGRPVEFRVLGEPWGGSLASTAAAVAYLCELVTRFTKLG